MQLTRILREGFIAGLIGAGAVALWFLVVDIIAGRPFFTPAMLGSAVFFGETDPSKAVIAFSRVVPYTMIHVCAVIIVGTVAAALAAEVEVAHPTLRLTALLSGGPPEPYHARRHPQVDRAAHPHDEAAQLLVRERREAPLPRARRRGVKGVQHVVGQGDQRSRDRHRQPQREQIEQLREVTGARPLRRG